MTRVLAALVVLCVFTTSCSFNYRYPAELEFVDDTLFLSSNTPTSFFWGVTTQNISGERLLRSKDHGRSWETISIPGLRDYVFFDSERGLLVVNGKLYRTNNGGYSRDEILAPDREILRIQRTGSVAAALSEKMVYLTYDFGNTWARVEAPIKSNDRYHVILQFAEIGGDLLAVADARGRVYVRGLNGNDWSEWIVGPLRDLRYHDGLFYALTAMSTVAVMDGVSVEHIRVEDDSSWFAKFVTLEKELYFYSMKNVYRIQGRELSRQSGSLDDLFKNGQITALTLVSPEEAIALMVRDERVTVQSIKFEPRAIQQIAVLP